MGAGGVLAGGLAPVAGLRHRIDIGLAGIHRRVHVGDLALHELEFADRPAELLALVDVGHDHVHAGLHDAERAGGKDGALIVQARHQNMDALIDFADDILLRHLAVLEHQFAGRRAAHAQLVELLGSREPVETFLRSGRR